jgi:nucleotidyltransferase substrate binding protein (TIGR01987 family)
MKTRFEEKKQDLVNAYTRLQEALAQPQNEFIRDSVIQRFEFCYEAAWKVMKLWLLTKDIDARNPKDVLKEALVQGLINDGDNWTKTHHYRNSTSHTYDESIADETYNFVKNYAAKLFADLITKL